MVGCGGISNSWLSVAAKHPHIHFVGRVDLHPESAGALTDAAIMIDAAEKAGRTYGVMQNRPWQPNGINRVKGALNDGVIGTPHTFHSDFFMGAHFGGFREKMKHILLLDMAIHS